MYSLYRAWFGGETCAPLAPLETLSPPDTLIRVGNDGEHQFVAHRGVLAAHSGYLKALLATASPASNSSNSNANATNAPGSSSNTGSVTSLSVSSVGSEAFAPLLNYMYTGRLEVTLDNIYSVLLATHLLHMPGALEQCRAALLRLRAPPHQAPTATAGGVLRPVPNRLIGPPLCWTQSPLYSTGPIGLPPLQTLSLPPTITAMHSRIIQDSRSTPYSRVAREKSMSPKPSTSQVQRIPRTPSKSTSPEPELPREEEEPSARRSPSLTDSSDRISVTETEPPCRTTHQMTLDDQGHAGSSSTSNVVIDIACCDGPVRFHRVLNANYAPGTRPQQQRTCVEDIAPENDENGLPEGPDGPDGTGSGSYTCRYCSHTFKSQYCYQKHARRHLHATEAAEGNGTPNGNGQQTGARKREVRLLDLNVQYYPCKICGSKFPSYYFVHKHRKLCHSNEDIQSGSDDLNVAHSSNSSNPQTQ